jgi:hypothetical protein
MTVNVNLSITGYLQGRCCIRQCKSSYQSNEQHSLHFQACWGWLDDDDDDDDDLL